MKKLLTNQYTFSLISKGIILVLGVLSSVFINRYLGPSLKGEYAYLLNIIDLLVLILNLGIYHSYPFYKRKKVDDIQDKYTSIIAFQFLIYTIVSIILFFIFGSKVEYILMFLLPALMVLKKQLGFIVLIENINLRNLINVFNQLFYTAVLLLFFLFAKSNIFYVFVLLYVKELISVIIIIYKLKAKISIFNVNINFMIMTIRFGLFPMLTSLLITLNYKVDILILESFVDFEQIGFYTVGVGLASQVWIIPDAFKDVLFSKTAKNDAIDDLKLSIKINVYISALFIVFTILFGKWLISVLYGGEYLPAYFVTVVMFVGLIPMIFYKLISPLFNATGKQKNIFYILLLSVLLNVGSNYLLIPLYGIDGAAFASVLSYSFCGSLFIYNFIKIYSLNLKELLYIDKNEIMRIKNSLKN